MSKKYDYLIIGSGLYGAMFVHSAISEGKSCLVIEKDNHIGGFCYSENMYGIEVHKYGAHIFRTNSRKTWDFVNSICEFVPFVNSPLANYKGQLFNLPFNMNTFHALWGVNTPQEAMAKIKFNATHNDNPKNLEEYIVSQIGYELYSMFVKGYTEKQWGKSCSELPASIIGRIPIRFTYDNNYYNCKYQGIPDVGYTEFIKRLLSGAEVMISTEYLSDKKYFDSLADKVVYTGAIDQYFGYKFGKLEYRAVTFEHKYFEDNDNYQGNVVINYTDSDMLFTRSIEHRHFQPDNTNAKGTVVTYEYPTCANDCYSPSYPIRTEENKRLYQRYKELADAEQNVIFGGRLAEYKYYSMNDIIEQFV